MMRRDNAIQSLQQSVRQISRQIEQMSNHFVAFQGFQRTQESSDNEQGFSSDSSMRSNPRRGGRRPPMDYFRDIKVEPPDFNGNLNPDEFLEWVQAMDRIFEAKCYNDEKSFKVASLKLTRYASLWFENIKKQRAREGKRKINSWEKLKSLMNKRFLPESYKQDIYNRLYSLKQNNMSVGEYMREFEQLLLRGDIHEPQEQTVARFLNGLDPLIARKVELQTYFTLDDVFKLALKVEKRKKEKKIFTKPREQVSSFPPFKPFFPPKPEGTSWVDKGKAVALPSPKELPKKLEGKKCFKCQGYGHFQYDCPNRRVMTMQEVEEVDAIMMGVQDEANGVNSDPMEGETHLDADEGELLVLRRVLHTQDTPFDKAQREMLFLSRCTIQDKVCNLIIDGGSCTNVASTILIEKLGIPTIPHPKPYSLKWINDGGNIKVSKQALISFSIGKKYKDDVLCDVVPMSACHVLLGRPWQFDRHVMHDGFKNTYSLVIDKEKIVLNPLPRNQVHKSKPGVGSEKKRDFLMMSETRVERALSKDKQLLALLMLESNKSEEVTPLHPKFGPLLSPCQVVFPQDQHPIDYFSGKYNGSRKNKLMPRSDGPFKVLEVVNDNAYKLELPEGMNTSSTFNVGDLTPYLEDEEQGDDLRANHIQEGEDEADAMSIQVQESSQVLLNAHELHQRELGPCAVLELQFQPHPEPLGCVPHLFWEGQEAF